MFFFFFEGGSKPSSICDILHNFFPLIQMTDDDRGRLSGCRGWSWSITHTGLNDLQARRLKRRSWSFLSGCKVIWLWTWRQASKLWKRQFKQLCHSLGAIIVLLYARRRKKMLQQDLKNVSIWYRGTSCLLFLHVSVGIVFIGTFLQFDSRRERVKIVRPNPILDHRCMQSFLNT